MTVCEDRLCLMNKNEAILQYQQKRYSVKIAALIKYKHHESFDNKVTFKQGWIQSWTFGGAFDSFYCLFM